MLYAACGMRQIASLHVAIGAASECRIGRGNLRMTSINYDIPENPPLCLFNYCGPSTVKNQVWLVGWLVGWLFGWLVGWFCGQGES